MRRSLHVPAHARGKIVSAHALGPDGRSTTARARPADTSRHGRGLKVYRSTDDGAAFPQADKPGRAADTNVWWQTLRVAPSSPQVISQGFSYIKDTAARAADTVRDHLVFRSDDGGASWTQLRHGFTLAKNR